MTTEEKLKAYILERYKSIREFTIKIDIPYSTLDSVFKRGIDNSSLGVIFKVCDALNIDVDALAEGEIVPRIKPDSITVTSGNGSTHQVQIREIDDVLAGMKKRLLNYHTLSLEGKPIKKEDAKTLVNGIDISLEMVKKSQS